MSRRWFTALRSATCELPGCGKPADRSVFILGGSRAWLCSEHADTLDIEASLKRASEPVERLAPPAEATTPASDETRSEAAAPVSNEETTPETAASVSNGEATPETAAPASNGEATEAATPTP